MARSPNEHWHTAEIVVVQRSLGDLGASSGLLVQPLNKYDLLEAL